VPKRPEEGLLLRSHRQLCHVLLLEMPAALLFLAVALRTGQVLPVEDGLSIGVRLMWSGLKSLRDGVQRLGGRVERKRSILETPP
jgi:hypothetical protein